MGIVLLLSPTLANKPSTIVFFFFKKAVRSFPFSVYVSLPVVNQSTEVKKAVVSYS